MTKTYCDICMVDCTGHQRNIQIPAYVMEKGGTVFSAVAENRASHVIQWGGSMLPANLRETQLQACPRCHTEVVNAMGARIKELQLAAEGIAAMDTDVKLRQAIPELARRMFNSGVDLSATVTKTREHDRWKRELEQALKGMNWAAKRLS